MHRTLAEVRDRIAALGTDITPAMVAGTAELAEADIDPALSAGVTVTKDIAYGPHERHVLDVYASADGAQGRPVLVFVHGGGFVQGAKDSDVTPFFGNVGSWAVQQGWVGVTINYRLAPEFGYPAGAEDVAAAITWMAAHIAEFGGDPAGIFLVGQSAGAMHVADYVVGHGGYGAAGRALAGAALISCIYDVGRAMPNGKNDAYWGEDTAAWPGYSTLQGLIGTDLPLLLTISEWDEREFQDQAAQLVTEWFARRGCYPPMHLLYGQNHLSTVYGIGAPWNPLAPLLSSFVEANS